MQISPNISIWVQKEISHCWLVLVSYVQECCPNKLGRCTRIFVSQFKKFPIMIVFAESLRPNVLNHRFSWFIFKVDAKIVNISKNLFCWFIIEVEVFEINVWFWRFWFWNFHKLLIISIDFHSLSTLCRLLKAKTCLGF